jgi:hypothetical protein
MLQMYAGDRLVLGVTRANVERLTQGQPIKADLLRKVSSVLIMFGETKPDILRLVEEAGIDVPDAWKKSAEADPL